MNAVVDCRSPEGAVLLPDPNPGLPDRAGEWHLDAESLLNLFAGEKVTLGAGVPTIWLGIR